jgi:hypothetical protein
MKVTSLSAGELAAQAVLALGLDGRAVGLFSPEGLCASLRRAASFLCPATPRRLADAVLDALAPLGSDSPVMREDVMDQLELLVGVGDLLELRDAGPPSTRQLFLGPPSYVEKAPGQYLLLGIRPYAFSLVDEEEFGAEITYKGHMRSIALRSEVASELFATAGLQGVTREQWAKSPRPVGFHEVLDAQRRRLAEQRVRGPIGGLRIMDPTSSVRNYRRRWREPKETDTGLFVGRRPQAYGADLWCALSLEHGVPQALTDLPVETGITPGCDEAWRLQAALDAALGHPQLYRLRSTAASESDGSIDLFAPVPSWAERVLELSGMPIPPARGALFSYYLSDGALVNVKAFLADMLWMQSLDEGEQSQ